MNIKQAEDGTFLGKRRLRRCNAHGIELADRFEGKLLIFWSCKQALCMSRRTSPVVRVPSPWPNTRTVAVTALPSARGDKISTRWALVFKRSHTVWRGTDLGSRPRNQVLYGVALAVMAITDQSVKLCIGEAEINTLGVFAGEAVGVSGFGTTA
jgi:hypothetical protein